ncbi:hypothetical protein GTD25_004448, partial [Salmonella enterica]|nr:hypothetical protein [Salmonella enterica]EDU7690920.1 hypothetical protein [Salmonella enterica subsp. enterica serovar Sandiego]EDS4434688.1 hypothetical protein [Salmonella enterica]EDS4874222.1 hypothetical protein [Salmonella enterica]EDX0857712.1 hypothetical protein [Salmonella enterica]
CDNDMGIKHNGDGTLDILANNQHTICIAPGEMQVCKQKQTTTDK